MARVVPLNTQMQNFADYMVRVLAQNYSNTLGRMYEPLFADHRSRTAANHYVMGENVFFENQAVHKAGAVRFGFSDSSTALHEDLHEAHYAWYNEFVDFKADLAKVNQTLRSIIMRAQSWQDFRDMFPEHIIRDFISENENLSVLYRTRPDLDIGPPHGVNYEQNIIDRSCWPIEVLSMYGRIGGTLSMYVGYKYL